MAENFHLSDTNPNDTAGGRGCIAHGDQHGDDCEGPYIIFYAVATDNLLSPHVVLCAHHFGQVSKLMASEDVLDLGLDTIESLDALADKELAEDDAPSI